MNKKATLVYQGGIANVFDTSDPSSPQLILQSTFSTCETFLLGMQTAGAKVEVRACNKAGDIRLLAWDTKYENAPFHSEFRFQF